MTSSLEKKHYEINRSRELEEQLPDSFKESDVLRIFVCFDEDSDDFTYIATKISPGKWYFNKEYFSWRSLLFWLDQNSVYELDSGCIQLASEWTPVQ